MTGKMLSFEEVSKMIENGSTLALAGNEALLARLPAGKWIGGTIPYFMAEEGGKFTENQIYATEIPAFATDARIHVYDTKTMENIYKDAAPHGFSLIIIPGSCQTHQEFALRAPQFDGFGTRVLVGWISGFNLAATGKAKPKIFDGSRRLSLEEGAVVMHVSLPKNKVVDVGIINVFDQSDGDVITFEQDGFEAKTAMVNGKVTLFSDYIRSRSIDTKLPLVADFMGAKVNTSFQSVDEKNGVVKFYAPVFKGVQYRLAKTRGEYISNFKKAAQNIEASKVAFTCNCILNYLYCELEGKKTSSITGPITFGEIAYQLLNQTLVYLTIQDS